MTPEQAAALREPFPAELVGKNQDNLDFVGHAAVTDRLLQVDPEWKWEPFGIDETGSPAWSQRAMVNKKGEVTGVKFATMWIRLTVAGVTRPAVGGVDVYWFTKDIEKLLISDALKNGAMRAGVALDLWSKEDLHVEGSITAEQAAQITGLFEQILDPAVRKRVGVAWANPFQWGKVVDVPASQFEAVYSSAMDAVEKEIA